MNIAGRTLGPAVRNALTYWPAVLHAGRPDPPDLAVDGDTDRTLPFFARVRFEGDRLLRFHAKVADTVVGPALAEAGAPEPHPFGAVLHKLMDNRGVSVRDLAQRTGRAMSTIHSARAGGRNPHPVLVAEIARALGIPEADLAAVAGVDGVDPHPAG
jgi:hypothetical protein